MASNIIPFPRRNSNDNDGDGPPQPGLRSFIVYDELPDDCIAFEDTRGESYPHIRLHEFAVVDTGDKDLEHDALYLIEWKSSGAREICGIWKRFYNCLKDDQKTFERRELWSIGGYAKEPLTAIDGSIVGPAGRWVDGPYEDQGVIDRIVGKVVGIYEPDFRRELMKAA